jgi:exosortase
MKVRFALVGLAGISLLLWWHALVATFSLAWQREEYTHLLLVAPLSVALLLTERGSLKLQLPGRVRPGALWLAGGLLLFAVGAWGLRNATPDVQLAVSMSGWVLWWIGTAVLLVGARTARLLMFPLGLLFFLVPLPQFAVDGIVKFLQYGSALAGRMLFVAAGVPVTQDGLVLSIPEFDLEIARECSSIRSSLLLVITTMVTAHLFLRSAKSKLAATIAAIPLAVLKNGFRIFVLAMLGMRVDPAYMDGDLHHHGGILFFALFVGAAALVVWCLWKLEQRVLAPARR